MTEKKDPLKNFKVVDISELSETQGQKITEMTKDEWYARGTELFGAGYLDWRFVCPACGHIASVRDFKQYKDQGANPNSATCECIGRYDGHESVVMGTAKPCNYTGYGLFDLCPVRVMDGDKVIKCFAFDTSGKD
jgi:hypothetical protein